MSWLWRSRHALTRFRRPLIPRGTRGVAGQFDHQPLPLPYKIEDGLGDFLPPPALEAVAMEYQLGLLARLTDEVRNTDIEDASVTQIIISTAPSRDKTLAFNYASLALNNSFFLGQLTPNINDTLEPAIYPPLYLQIQTDHGGLEQLKSAFSAAAMGMFTSGYIWFVTDKYGSTSILPTLGPGTLLVRSRTYAAEGFPNLYHGMTASPFGWDKEQQYVGKYLADWGMDGRGDRPPILDPKHMSKFMGALDDRLPTLPSSSNGNYGANTPLQTRFMHLSARRFAEWDASPPGIHDPAPLSAPSSQYKHTDALHVGEVLYPLFCLPVQEHAWLMAGYGVWGKEAWLREFWNVLNWRQVGQSYAHILKH